MLSPSPLSNVVSIGGGTGLSCLLKGLKYSVLDFPEPPSEETIPWISRLTAVVTVTDDGGSSGRLRNELKVLPPGDIRNCLVALSMDESLLSHLFQYRFAGRGQLQGHSFGNLFLTALTGVTGDFLKAIQVSSDVVATRGRIYPSTLEDVRLEAVLQDGTTLMGESAIAAARSRVKKISLTPGGVRPVAAVLEAIRMADIVTIGPGSLFTSLIPNLLVKGISREIKRSKALKIFIGNLMTQPGETTGFRASDHIQAIWDHTGCMFFDGIILNNKQIAGPVLSRYRREGAVPVHSDIDVLEEMGLRVFQDDLLAQGKVVRHDPALLANAVYRAGCRWNGSRAPLRAQTISESS
jgi:uncharacterized cofD-like protein